MTAPRGPEASARHPASGATDPARGASDVLARGRWERLDEDTQRRIWVAFFIVLALSLSVGIAFGLMHGRRGANSMHESELPRFITESAAVSA